jgi:hypothetical protein
VRRATPRARRVARAPLQLLALVSVAMFGASCRHLIPNARPPFTITGIVQSMDAEALSLRHKSGQIVRIAVAPRTTVSREKQPAGLADVQVGMRVVVSYRFIGGAPVADEVRLFRPPIKPAT